MLEQKDPDLFKQKPYPPPPFSPPPPPPISECMLESPGIDTACPDEKPFCNSGKCYEVEGNVVAMNVLRANHNIAFGKVAGTYPDSSVPSGIIIPKTWDDAGRSQNMKLAGEFPSNRPGTQRDFWTLLQTLDPGCYWVNKVQTPSRWIWQKLKHCMTDENQYIIKQCKAENVQGFECNKLNNWDDGQFERIIGMSCKYSETITRNEPCKTKYFPTINGTTTNTDDWICSTQSTAQQCKCTSASGINYCPKGNPVTLT